MIDIQEKPQMSLAAKFNNVYSWLVNSTVMTNIQCLSDNEIMNIANEVNSLLTDKIQMPRLVVVGTQSSGKSSVLNAIIGMNILPTGKSMVTRTPLDIRLHKTPGTAAWIELAGEKIVLNISPTDAQIEQVCAKIISRTEQVAGVGMNINATPIIIDIYSPNIPNLSLIDLPGLTQVACTDKGQPPDIKQRIEKLVEMYITAEQTIVLVVCAARVDLETDQGLALIKKYDNHGQRTIGVLTKPDLVGSGAHIGDYLTGNISSSLKLLHGYYVVCNQGTVDQRTELEKKYFTDHPVYSKPIYAEQIGISNLTKNLSSILVECIKDAMPRVMAELNALEMHTQAKLDVLGEPLPETLESKMMVLNKYVSNIYYKFIDSIESRSMNVNTGKLLKETFIAYRQKITTIHPFLSNAYSKEYFKEISSSFEGNHMSVATLPVQVLEAAVTDPKLKPLMTIRDPALYCIDKTVQLLIELIQWLTKQDEFSKFPKLADCVVALVGTEINKRKQIVKDRVAASLQDEHSYVWTDSPEFMKILGQKDQNFNQILDVYYSTVADTFANLVPKMIMSNIVRDLEQNLLTTLIHQFVTAEKITLLKEDENLETERKQYSELRSQILKIKQNFNTLLGV